MVQWESPLETGASGVYISEYTVTVDGNSTESVTDDGRDVFTHTISGLEYNREYEVNVTAIDSCGLSSRSVSTYVFIEARGMSLDTHFVCGYNCFLGPPEPALLPPVLSCDVPLSNGRPVVFSWMVSVLLTSE